MAGNKNSARKTHTSARRKRAMDVETKKKTTERKPSVQMPNIKVWIVAIAVAVVVLFLGISTYSLYAGDRETAKAGVSVLGIDVGGMHAAEIKALLEEQGMLQDFAVTYICDGESETVTAEDVSLVLDVEKTTEAAVSHGRKNIFSAFAALFAKKEIAPVYTYDVFALADASVALSRRCGGSLKQHEVTIGEEDVRIRAGASGTGVDLEKMQKYFEEAILVGGGEYKLSLTKTKPAQINIDELYETVFCESANAHYTIEGKEVTITPEVNGKSFDKAEAARQLADFGEGSETVIIPLDVTEATIKAEDINKTLFADVLGKYSTKYLTSNKPRANNVELAARYVDGTILLPGDEFSYNNVVGPRTAARGFKAASVYENNKMVDGLGGGICQTSSTIYAAVLYADLEVTERHEHSLEVHYIELGMDATVSYGTLDFRFKNNTDAPVKVVAKASGGTVNVQILGTQANPNKKVEIVTERLSFTPYGTTTVNDETLEPGKTVQDAEGFNGAVVNTYKIITENGKQLSNKLLHKSTYRMANRIIRVGVAPDTLPVDPNAPVYPNPPTDSNTATDPSVPTDPTLPTDPTVVPEGL